MHKGAVAPPEFEPSSGDKGD